MTTAKTDHTALLSSLSPNVLAFLNAAFATAPSPEIAAKLVTVNLDASKLITPRSPRSRKNKGEKPATPSAASLNLPEKGSIDYAEFLCLLRDAGMRQAREEYTVTDEVTGEVIQVVDMKTNRAGEPIMVFDRNMERVDQRDAIAAYVGYDISLPHGTQLDNARLTARAEQNREARQIAGISIGESTHRNASAHAEKWATPGFTAGMPHPLEKLLADLAGRERMAVTDLVNFGKLRDFMTAAGNATLDPKIRISAKADYDKLLAREYPATQGYEARVNAYGQTVGYDRIEIPSPIVKTLAGKSGSDLIAALDMLEALAQQRLEEIRKDIAGVDLDQETAWQAVADFASREYHAAPRAGEDEKVADIDAKGNPIKITRFEERQNEMANLWDLSQRAKDGDKAAMHECFMWTIARAQMSLAQRGAPTIEDALVLLNDTPRA